MLEPTAESLAAQQICHPLVTGLAAYLSGQRAMLPWDQP